MNTEASSTTELLRKKILEEAVLPYIREHFKAYPQLQSAMLLIAQYWNDEADDAVHSEYIFSVLDTPDLAAFYASQDENDDFEEEDEADNINLPGLDSHWNLLDVYDEWDDNGEAIPAFAAFCKEGASQEDTIEEAYTPYAIFRRQGEKINMEIIGKQLRPWLDGLQPE